MDEAYRGRGRSPPSGGSRLGRTMDAVDDAPNVPPIPTLYLVGNRQVSRARYRVLQALALAAVVLLLVAIAIVVPINRLGGGSGTSSDAGQHAGPHETQTVVIESSSASAGSSDTALLVAATSGVASVLTAVAALITALRAPRADPKPAESRRRRR